MTESEQGCLEVAREVLRGLDDGFHYAVLQYGDDLEPIEIVWNHERNPELDSRKDDFSDKEKSMRHRQMAVEYQRQFKKSSEQATLCEVVADGS